MNENIQLFIIKGLFENTSFFRNVLTNLDPIYFDEDKGQLIKFVKSYFQKYEKIPTYSVAFNMISQIKVTDELREEIEESLTNIKKFDFDPLSEDDWLFDQTRDFVNEKAMFLVLKKGAMQLSNGDVDYGSIEIDMREALSMDWNDDLGIDYFDVDAIDDIYDNLSDHSKRIPIGVDVIDDAILGGIPGDTKFCMVYVGSAGIGKTLILGNTALNAVINGKDVLYITFEIDDKELRRRIDASFTDYSVRNITQVREKVKQKIKEAKASGKMGRFIIKEFPPASVSSLDIESFLHTLRLKKQFKPKLIVLDYLGIMVPNSNEHSNSYEKGKAVCEEIRCLSDRHKCPIITAAQTNRSGYGQSNIEMGNIADSMGIAHTADLIISLAQPEELKENNQMKFDIVKSRISKTGASGIVDIDYDKLKIINNAEEEQISDIISTGMKEIDTIKKDKFKGIT